MEDIREYLRNERPNGNFYIEEIVKRPENKSKNKSFKVGMEYDILDDMRDPDIWPENLVIERLKFFRGTTKSAQFRKNNFNEPQHTIATK